MRYILYWLRSTPMALERHTPSVQLYGQIGTPIQANSNNLQQSINPSESWSSLPDCILIQLAMNS